MKALRCIKSNDTGIEDPYKLAVLAYALRLAYDPDKISIFSKLRNLEIRAGKESEHLVCYLAEVAVPVRSIYNSFLTQVSIIETSVK